MSTTRGNGIRGTLARWLKAPGISLAAVIAGLCLTLVGAPVATAQSAPQAWNRVPVRGLEAGGMRGAGGEAGGGGEN